MLSYQHAFHAGNHADILKHYVLCFVLNSLNKKEKPYTFYDTHSGSGLYDLLDNRSLKTEEASKGIKTLLSRSDLPAELNLYIETVNKFYDKNFYPGSPAIEKSFIRNQDFMFLSELHPVEFENLKTNVGNNKNVQILNTNGFTMLKGHTPPVTKRGAVLIDPSYEESADYEDVSKTVIAVNKKWSNGIIMVWYPLLSHRKTEIEYMVDSITQAAKTVNPNTEILNLQLCVNSPDSHVETDLQSVLNDTDKKNPPRLYGSGMLVINAPWHLAEEGESVIKYLSDVFYSQKSL